MNFYNNQEVRYLCATAEHNDKKELVCSDTGRIVPATAMVTISTVRSYQTNGDEPPRRQHA